MVEIWYCDTSDFSEMELAVLLKTCSMNQRDKIQRYQNLSDRLTRAVALQFIAQRLNSSPDQIERTSNGKPFVKGALHFNISHSESKLVVAFSESVVGVDLEVMRSVNTAEIAPSFHTEEIEYLKNQPNREESFYRIWTRKEAFLKAKGIGVVEGLNSNSCLADEVEDNGTKWYLKSIEKKAEIALAICQDSPIFEYEMKEVTKSEIMRYVHS